MKKSFYLIVLLTSMGFLSSCYHSSEYIYADPSSSFIIDLPSVTQLNQFSSDDFELTFEGRNSFIQVIGQESRLHNFDYNVGADGLSIYNVPNSYSIRINLPYLSHLNVEASGDIHCHGTLFTDFLEIYSNGSGDTELSIDVREVLVTTDASGDVRLSGFSRILDVLVSGSGDVRAQRLEALEAFVKTQSSGDIRLFVRNYLKAGIYGSGDIIVESGHPTIDIEDHGSGNLYY